MTLAQRNIVASVVLLVLVCLIPDYVLLLLFVGWSHFIRRSWPQVQVSGAGLATSLVTAALAVAVLHLLATWLCRNLQARTAWPWRWTGSLVAGVVVMFTAGLAGVGLFRNLQWLLLSDGHPR